MSNNHQESENEELEFYGDENITSKDAPVPRSLKIWYIFITLWGLIWFYCYFNGSHGWLDGGYWNQLQKAAKTTYVETDSQ